MLPPENLTGMSILQQLKDMLTDAASDQGHEEAVSLSQLLLGFYPSDGEEGQVQPAYREISTSNTLKELKRLRTQLDRLRDTLAVGGGRAPIRPSANLALQALEALHQTSIVLLADHWFTARDQLKRFISGIAKHVGNGPYPNSAVLDIALVATTSAIEVLEREVTAKDLRVKLAGASE